jgi:hypothetical protein
MKICKPNNDPARKLYFSAKFQWISRRIHDVVRATHSKSSASQSQPRNHQLLRNGSVNTYRQRWNPWTYNLLLGKPNNNTCFPSGPTQVYITGDQTKWDWRKTAADVVHLCKFCISNIKDLYKEVNRGYLFTMWHNLWKVKARYPQRHVLGNKNCHCHCFENLRSKDNSYSFVISFATVHLFVQ